MCLLLLEASSAKKVFAILLFVEMELVKGH